MDENANEGEEIRCSSPDGAVGDTWRDDSSDDTWVLVKTCSVYGNWVETGKELKNK